MSARNISRKVRVQQLRAAYKEAFDEWAFATTRLQFLVRSAESKDAIADARSRVAAAHSAYRETRDLLAANLVNCREKDCDEIKVVPIQTARSAVHQ